MVRHQVVVTDRSQFPNAQASAGELDLNWHLLRLGDGWVLINSDYGNVELIDQAALSESQVEDIIFKIVRQHCQNQHLEDYVGLSPEYVSWTSTKRLSSFIKHRYAEVKELYDEVGSFDKAWFQIGQLNHKNLLGLDDYSPDEWLSWFLDKESTPQVKISIFVRIWNTLFNRRPWEKK